MFNEEDFELLLLARTVADWNNAFDYDTGDYSPDHWYCMYCNEKSDDHAEAQGGWKDIKHKAKCPYLVAKDILTGYEEEK